MVKVNKVEIKNWRQFTDFSVDLVYPRGHEKAGLPLDRICILGENGVGKSNLLGFLREGLNGGSFHRGELSFESKRLTDGNGGYGEEVKRKERQAFDFEVKGHIGLSNGNQIDLYGRKGKSSFNLEQVFPSLEVKEVAWEYFGEQDKGATRMLHFPSKVKTGGVFREKSAPQEKWMVAESSPPYGSLSREKKCFDFGKSDPRDLWWWYFLEEKEHLMKESSILQRIQQHDSSDTKGLEALKEEYADWKTRRPTPLASFVQALNPLLKERNLHLRSKYSADEIDVFYNWFEMIGRGDEKLDYELWGDGIQKVVSFSSVIHFFAKESPMIMMDEPENFLSPNLLRDWMELINEVRGDSQLVVATHSPIVAAQFDPAERIILEFDEEGKISWHRGRSPEGDDPNDLLSKDFGMSPLLSGKGQEMLERYIALKQKMRFEKDEKAKEVLMDEYLLIGSRYNFGNEKSH